MENNTMKSCEINFLLNKINDEANLKSADYIEFQKNAERLLMLLRSNEMDIKANEFGELEKALVELNKLERKENVYSNVLNTAVAAVGISAILGAFSAGLAPVISASALAALASIVGYTLKLKQNDKEESLAREISSNIRNLVVHNIVSYPSE